MNEKNTYRLLYCYGDNSQYDFVYHFLDKKYREEINLDYWVGKEVKISYSTQFCVKSEDYAIEIYSPVVPKGWKIYVMQSYRLNNTSADKILIFTSFPYEKEDIYGIYYDLYDKNEHIVLVLYEKNRKFAASDYFTDNNIENIVNKFKKQDIDVIVVSSSDNYLIMNRIFSLDNDYMGMIERKLQSDVVRVENKIERFDRRFNYEFDEYINAFSIEGNIVENEQKLFLYSADMRKKGVWQVIAARYKKSCVESEIKLLAVKFFEEFLEDTNLGIFVTRNTHQKLDSVYNYYFVEGRSVVLAANKMEYQMNMVNLRNQFKKNVKEFIDIGVRNCIKSELIKSVEEIKKMLKG